MWILRSKGLRGKGSAFVDSVNHLESWLQFCACFIFPFNFFSPPGEWNPGCQPCWPSTLSLSHTPRTGASFLISNTDQPEMSEEQSLEALSWGFSCRNWGVQPKERWRSTLKGPSHCNHGHFVDVEFALIWLLPPGGLSPFAEKTFPLHLAG